jgi:Helix-hairpin-helix motif
MKKLSISLYFVILILAVLVFCQGQSQAQSYPRPEIDIDNFILELFPQPEDDFNFEKVYETLFQLYRNPLNINKVNREELQSIFILSELQINSLLDYRKKFGNFLTIYELQSVPNIDLNTIYKLLPFVTAGEGNQKSSKNLWQRMKSEADAHYLLFRYSRTLETQKGFTDEASESQRYSGSPDRMYMRYRLSNANDFSVGFTLEKDAGEQLGFNSEERRYGADFISYHAYFQNQGKFKTIALGDFQMQFGQGLLLSAGLGIGKGAETVLTIRRSNLGIMPFTSALETGYFRGVGATYQLGRVEITGFYSRIRRDGSISESEADSTGTIDIDEDNLFIETLRTTGLHRTASEIAGKGIFIEQSYGTNILYSNKQKSLQIGGIFLNTSYNLPFQRSFRSQKDSLRFLYEFSGKSNSNFGLHFTYQWQNFNFFGEGARSSSGGIGAIGGFVASLSASVDLAMVYRHYDKDFHTFFGSALSESTRNINESGMYWGLKISPNRKIKFNAYYDLFKFPWIRYRLDRPSAGYEFLGRLTYNFSRKVALFGQMRQEVKERNVSSDDSQTALGEIRNTVRRNYIVNLSYKAEKILSFQTRLQASSFDFNGNNTRGYALVQDIGLELGKLGIDLRFALFDTDDFDNRQYIYEKDVLWAFSFPAYNGRGIRQYILFNYKIHKKLELWLRYARFDYRNQDTISSGGEEIEGNTRSEIRAQLRFKF